MRFDGVLLVLQLNSGRLVCFGALLVWSLMACLVELA